jgi:thymidylate synthase
MRFYETFPIALNEIRRELKEMGIAVHTQSVQNMDVSQNEDYNALELQNYQYLVSRPDYVSIPLKNPEWCIAEFQERVSGEMLNPGEAYKLRLPYWSKFLNKWGRFDYAYPQRMTLNLDHVINALRKDPSTRRAYLPILGLEDHADSFDVRFPCSIGYHFLYRQGRLTMRYDLRSSDFSEHFNNDIWLATRLLHYVAARCDMTPGYFCHSIGSLHCFHKDVKGVF